MKEDRESNIKIYSLGIVVHNKPDDVDFIDVHPAEYLTIEDGLIKDVKYKYDVEFPDADGIKKKDKMEGNMWVVAKWIPFSDSNRISAPDVIKGETVVIWRYADTDQYYWHTIFREPNLRRLERVLYSYSNQPKGDPIIAFDKESSYWIEWSTKDKWIHLHTANNDGEPFIYDVTINTGEGWVELIDSAGNFIKLDSTNSTIHAKALSEIILEAPLITHICDETHITGHLTVDKGADIVPYVRSPHFIGIVCEDEDDPGSPSPPSGSGG